MLVACVEGDRPVEDDNIVVFHNGKIVTLDEHSTIVSVIVVRNDRIAATGGDELKRRYSTAKTIDLGGKTMLPGFVDSHTHIGGEPNRYIDLSKSRSVAEIVQQVRDKAAELGPDEWITGYGWSEDVMAEQRRPLRGDLDQGSLNNPVMLTRAGGHSAVANSLALALAGVDKDTPQPEGGVIEYGSF